MECGEEGLRKMSWKQTRGLAADLALDQQRRLNRALYYATKHFQGRLPVGRPLWFRRPFHDDDEKAHRLVTEHKRDLGERLQHEDDFPDEDVTGQDEPPVDSPPTQEESTATGPPGPDGERQMDVKERTRPVSPEQSASGTGQRKLLCGTTRGRKRS